MHHAACSNITKTAANLPGSDAARQSSLVCDLIRPGHAQVMITCTIFWSCLRRRPMSLTRSRSSQAGGGTPTRGWCGQAARSVQRPRGGPPQRPPCVGSAPPAAPGTAAAPSPCCSSCRSPCSRWREALPVSEGRRGVNCFHNLTHPASVLDAIRIKVSELHFHSHHLDVVPARDQLDLTVTIKGCVTFDSPLLLTLRKTCVRLWGGSVHGRWQCPLLSTFKVPLFVVCQTCGWCRVAPAPACCRPHGATGPHSA